MVIYSAEQKIYFQLKTVQQILEGLEIEICDLGMGDVFSEIKIGVQEISTEAYGKLKAENMRFKDLPKGARFRFHGGTDVWVAIETYGKGLIARWEGINSGKRQSLCSFVDDEHSLESEVQVIN